MRLLQKTINEILPLSRTLEKNARHKMDLKTKPAGSLGRLEEMAVRMSLIQNSLTPKIAVKKMFVFAGDHGIAAEGVSAYPAEVTPQMVLNFLHGGAAINVLCRQAGAGISVIDMGVNYEFGSEPGLINKKVRKGTRNFLIEDSMTVGEAIRSIELGIEVFDDAYKTEKFNIAGVGEMGIGNSTSAAAIISAATGLSPEKTAGRGTGLNDTGFKNKVEIIARALGQRKPDPKNGLDILQKVGGFEIGGIAGACLAAAAVKIPVVLDGLISTAGGLIAYLIKPYVKDYFFSGHKSVEAGQKAALKMLELEPILDLGMRLGEGTGAVLAINLIEASCRIMCEMSSFEEAGVSGSL